MGESGVNLLDRHCRAGAPRLSAEESAGLARQVPDWKMHDGRLEKTFPFPDFRTALEFVNRLGAVAEEEGHHPDIHLGWGRVGIQLSTHDAGGLTENDFILAAKADRTHSSR